MILLLAISGVLFLIVAAGICGIGVVGAMILRDREALRDLERELYRK